MKTTTLLHLKCHNVRALPDLYCCQEAVGYGTVPDGVNVHENDIKFMLFTGNNGLLQT
jgi:hypothetical protein